MSRNANISVFVPHIGCPNKCSFCNQFLITGKTDIPTAETVKSAVRDAKTSKNYSTKNTELAFFGGSFTAIDKEYMLTLLKAGYEFVKSGDVAGIRISTRPDAITSDILKTLKEYGVTAIELGCQSMDNKVLALNFRGHSEQDVYVASKKIKDFGFSLGLQMMTGLLGDNNDTAKKTAEKIIKIAPDTVRIYPTIVFKGTYLAKLFKENKYKPQSLLEAVDLVAELKVMFQTAGIKVIRTGLHSVETEGMIAGPWHPAFGEMCESKIYLTEVLKQLKLKNIPAGEIKIRLPKGSVSKMLGQKKANLEILTKMGYNIKLIECDENIIKVE